MHRDNLAVFFKSLMAFSFALGVSACATANLQSRTPAIQMNPELVEGTNFTLSVTGLVPFEEVRVHGLRTMRKWARGANGQWGEVDVNLHAWGAFVADGRGRVNLTTAKPTAGTWRTAGSEALFWSGYPEGAPDLIDAPSAVAAIPSSPLGSLTVAVTRGETLIARDSVKVITSPNVSTTAVREQGLVGVYATPTGARKLPVIVLLHGSEGGKLDRAGTDAARFAAQGYAVLAITYFSYPWESIPGTPNAHVDIPVETVAKARDWLSRQESADVQRFGVYGVSKGAEFAALAASIYPWIDAVVPCVGSDVVWEGYGIEPRPSPPPSSWSQAGQSLPALELIPYVEGDPRFATNTQRYNQSRDSNTSAQIAAARIPIEQSRAQFLFLGSDRDLVWASGQMSRALNRALSMAGKARQSQLKVYPLAGHNICGSGLFPVRLYGQQSSAAYSPDLTEEGEAAVDAWKLTKAFFARSLRPNHRT